MISIDKNKKNKWKVDFVGIAAPRCGTTWISKCLEEHPEICFSNPKESFFFIKDELYSQGVGTYENFFSDTQKTCGEYSPFYYTDKKVAMRIYEHNPDVKLIVSLRNPVDRIVSAYNYRKQKGRELGRDLLQAIENESGYVEYGKYYSFLKPFIDIFPKKNIKIIILEEAFSDPHAFIQDLYRFLGVDQSFLPLSLVKSINATKDAHTYIPLFYRITDFRKKLKLTKCGQILIYVLKILGIGKVVAKLSSLNMRSNSEYEHNIEEHVRLELNKHFYQSNKDLFKYLNREVSQWK